MESTNQSKSLDMPIVNQDNARNWPKIQNDDFGKMSKPTNRINQRTLLFVLSLTTFFILIPQMVFASSQNTKPYIWRNVKIGGGGFVSGVTFHPTEPNLVYARTDVGGAYVSNDGGLNWTPITDSLGRNDPTGVISIAL